LIFVMEMYCVFFAVQTECLDIIMRSSYGVHEVNAYRDAHVYLSVCLSVRMIQLENRWTDLDEILYGYYATGFHPKIILLNFLQSVIPT
jgi:hypothetical protein